MSDSGHLPSTPAGFPATHASDPKHLFSKMKNAFAPGAATTVTTAAPSLEPSLEPSSLASAVPLAVDALADTLNPPHPVGSTVKEVREANFTLEKPQFDQVPGVQYVEGDKDIERNAEIPVEVEAFLQEMQNHPDQIPAEVVITDATTPHPTTPHLAKPVIILPITAEEEKIGAQKSPEMSIRWLVEWSRKIMKMFSGRVVYRADS